MMSTVDRNGLEILERAECLRLLATATMGRLAYVHSGIPAVIPVNVALAEDTLLFRLGTGGALAAIYARQPVTLEVDAIDLDACCGWSINITGSPLEIAAATAASAGQELRSWLRPNATRLFRLGTEHLEGRRLAGPVPAHPSPIASLR
jgi:hypothetical protein